MILPLTRWLPDDELRDIAATHQRSAVTLILGSVLTALFAAMVGGANLGLFWGLFSLVMNISRTLVARRILTTPWLANNPLQVRGVTILLAVLISAMWPALGHVLWSVGTRDAQIAGLLLMFGPMFSSPLQYRSCRRLFSMALTIYAGHLAYLAYRLLVETGSYGLAFGVVLACAYISLTAVQMLRDQMQLKASRTAAQTADRMKSALLATMSHEIRTPLVGVLGAAEALKGPLAHEQQTRMIDTIMSSADLLLTILNDILDFSKIEAGAMTLAPRPARLADVAQLSLGPFIERAHAKGLQLASHVEPQLPEYAVLDDLRLRQVLMNLISNAVKFTAHGRVDIHLGQRTFAQGQVQLAISVSDTGEGIDATTLARLFKPFVQADPGIARRHGGTGLGLAISRRLVELMDGQLTARSRPGLGSTFEVLLPLQPLSREQALASLMPTASTELEPPASAPTLVTVPMTAAQPANPPAASKPTPTPSTGPAVRADKTLTGRIVLLAEDNPVNRHVVSVMLNGLGATVLTADDGEQALNILAAQSVDAVLMDIQMPVVDGITATERLRTCAGPNQAVPVIGFTANAFAEDREQCRRVGMHGFVAKPARRHEVERELLRVLTPQPDGASNQDLVMQSDNCLAELAQ